MQLSATARKAGQVRHAPGIVDKIASSQASNLRAFAGDSANEFCTTAGTDLLTGRRRPAINGVGSRVRQVAGDFRDASWGSEASTACQSSPKPKAGMTLSKTTRSRHAESRVPKTLRTECSRALNRAWPKTSAQISVGNYLPLACSAASSAIRCAGTTRRSQCLSM